MSRLLSLMLATFGLNAQSAPPHPLFDTDQVHTIRLRFAQPDWYQQLRVNFEGATDPDYAEADLEIGELRYEKIGIRFKGNSSYNSYPGQKKSFKIKLNKYAKGQKYEGMDTINLNNAFKDPSFVREKVYYELANGLGLAAPRVNYAALYIDDQYWGLYFLTEQVDKALIQGRFGREEDGNLFKGDPRGTLEHRGEDAAPYKQMYKLETNESADYWTDLISLTRALNSTPAESLAGAIEPMLDVEGALSLLALDNYTVNLDSYIGSGHNYYLYHRMSDDRFTPIPWDPNEAWGVFTMNMPLEALVKLPVAYPAVGAGPSLLLGPGMSGPPRPLATRLFATPEYRGRYLEKLRTLATGIGHPDLLTSRMTALRDLIRPFVLEDTKKMFSNEEFEAAMTKDIRTGIVGGGPGPGGANPPSGAIPALEGFVRSRFEWLMGQLP